MGTLVGFVMYTSCGIIIKSQSRFFSVYYFQIKSPIPKISSKIPIPMLKNVQKLITVTDLSERIREGIRNQVSFLLILLQEWEMY